MDSGHYASNINLSNLKIKINTVSKNLIILGAGESGTGAAVLGKMLGYNVLVSDSSAISEKHKEVLRHNDIDFEENGHSIEKVLSADFIVKSPGIPDKAEVIKAIKAKDIKMISEIEFASDHCDGKIIAITGTNGKTTTATMCFQILKDAGLDVALGGNIGKSFASLIAERDHDFYVLEISSFQLDNCYNFKPDIAIITNITPDHLDRYNYNVEEYAASKFRITQNQDKNDVLILCQDDELTQSYMPKNLKAKQIPFSLEQHLSDGACKENGQLTINKNNQKIFDMNIQQLGLRGMHNTFNGMAAAIMGNVLNIKDEVIRNSLMNFENIEHRLEDVATINGVEYINDSKATNVNSVWYALESIDKPIIWIAGGVDKGNDYGFIKNLVKDKVKMIICLGVDNLKIHQAFGADVELIVNTTSAKDAVDAAYKLAAKGDVVLLSPACASFDLFDSYEDRGRQFKAAVKSL